MLSYGTRSQGISQFYLHTPRSSANGMNHLPLPSQPKLVLIYRPRRDGRLSWPWVAGWLHTEISVRHRELNPDTVTHLSINRARRRLGLTSLIEVNTLTTTPDHHYLKVMDAKVTVTVSSEGMRSIVRHRHLTVAHTSFEVQLLNV